MQFTKSHRTLHVILKIYYAKVKQILNFLHLTVLYVTTLRNMQFLLNCNLTISNNEKKSQTNLRLFV